MLYVIWSFRHNQWWQGSQSGYSPHLESAGRYTTEEAADITIGGGLPGANIAIDEALAMSQFAGSLPSEVLTKLNTWRTL